MKMFQSLFLAGALLLTSNVFAADLNNFDIMESKGYGCFQYINLAEAVAQNRDDPINIMSHDLQRADSAHSMHNDVKNFIEIVHPGFYDDLYQHITSLIVEIWTNRQISTELIKKYATLNCEVFKGETSKFLSLNQWELIRKQL